MRLHNATALAAIFAAAFSTGAVAQTDDVSTDVDTGVNAEVDAGVDAEVSTPDTAVDEVEDAADPAEKAAKRAEQASKKPQKAADRAAKSSRREAAAEAGFKNYGQLISSLRADDSEDDVSEIEVLSDVSADATIDTVTVSDLEGAVDENANALDQALADDEEQISEIQATIEDNPDLVTAIEEDGYTVDDVVAVETTADGDVTFVVEETS